jgi:hypothetical protein
MRYPDIAEVVKNGHEIIAFRTQTPRALYKMYFYEDLYYQVDSGDNELVAVYGKNLI